MYTLSREHRIQRMTLRFDSGAIATFSFSRRTGFGYEEMLEVFGAEGMLESRRQPRTGGAVPRGCSARPRDRVHRTSFRQEALAGRADRPPARRRV